jgi:hypothetical protein
VGIDDCAEKLDCDALGWAADLHGSAEVCGSSSLVGEFGSSDLCVREKSYDEAKSLCTERGGRLCTASELQSDEGDPGACSYSSIFSWSWVDTPPGVCPSANQSLGMPGGAGRWYSFVPTELDSYYEIQLRSEHALDGDSFTILGVYDARAETVSGQAAILYHRDDGAMLRWNATQIGGATFVHVRSTVADATYTMAAVLPQVYSWRPVPVQPDGHAGATVLALAQNGVVAVDLPFGFPFFGLEHRRVWISSFGMVLFEEPHEVGSPFGGTGPTHSALMAAAGDFDLSRAGASVTTSQRSPTELRVSWHAPMFSSAVFSDVSVVLAEEGTVTIEWHRIDLSGGGSLGHGLLSHVSAESDSGFVVVGGRVSHMGPNDAIGNVTAGAFYGADPGEGLDLSGRFDYAVTLGQRRHTVGDVVFTPYAETIGVVVDGQTNPWSLGSPVDFCAEKSGELFQRHSPNTDALADFICQGCHGPRIVIGLNGIVPGAKYRLQLLFYVSTSKHGADVFVNGQLVYDDFSTQISGHNQHAGEFLRYDFTATEATLTIMLDNSFMDCRALGSGCRAALNAFTLERVVDPPSAIPQSLTTAGTAIRLVDNTYLQLPSLTLGGAIAVSAWVQVGTLWNGEVGITLFNSFESDGCLDSDACRNAVDGTLDRSGWFAVGNDVEGKRPADLWTTGAVYNQGTAGLFWEGARDEWMMVTVAVSGRGVSVYTDGELRGSALLNTQLARMMRHNN